MFYWDALSFKNWMFHMGMGFNAKANQMDFTQLCRTKPFPQTNLLVAEFPVVACLQENMRDFKLTEYEILAFTGIVKEEVQRPNLHSSYSTPLSKSKTMKMSNRK